MNFFFETCHLNHSSGWFHSELFETMTSGMRVRVKSRATVSGATGAGVCGSQSSETAKVNAVSAAETQAAGAEITSRLIARASWLSVTDRAFGTRWKSQEESSPEAVERELIELIGFGRSGAGGYIPRATVWMVISTLSLTRRNRVLGFFMPHFT